MSGLFPEPPILFYPSIARRYGAEEAVLLAVYDQYARHHGDRDEQGRAYFIARRGEWLELISFWSEERLAQLTSSLVTQGALDAEFRANGSIRILLTVPVEASVPPAAPVPSAQTEAAQEPMSPPTVAQSRPEPVEAPPTPSEFCGTGMVRGPAPSFGGSNGWRRPKDDLQHLFESRERQNRLLQEITLAWRPNETSYQLLTKRNIPTAFIDDCIDEFVSYWMALGTKKHTWDSEFIKRVNSQWVKEQSRQGRTARQSGQQSVEGNGERHQSNHRAERRERITEAVMDIHNTDW